MPINSFLYPATQVVSGYEVANSLRFNDDDSAYMYKTLGTPTNAYKGTISHWIKKSVIGASETEYGTFAAWLNGGSTTRTHLNFYNNTIYLYAQSSSGTVMVLQTNRVFRDPNAWYHIVVAWDTTQATASNRVKIYVNGVQETSFSTETYPAQNTVLQFNTSGRRFGVGTLANGSGSAYGFWDGYIAEFCFIDGQQLDATSFGEFDEDSGIWKPIDVSGLTFGNNGFYLDFENSGSLGADVSGNGNNFTVNNLTSIDQSIDTCTNNFCTLSSLNPTQQATLSQGNLKAESSSAYKIALSTIAVSSGKWFLEHKIGSSPNLLVGVIDSQDYNSDNAINFVGENTNSVGYFSFNGKKYIANANSTYGATYTENDIIGLALDLDSGTKTITFYKNGASQGSINLPTAGSQEFYFLPSPYNGSIEMNFGSPPYSETGGNSDANGYGNFSMAVPSGHYCLCTKNLAEYG